MGDSSWEQQAVSPEEAVRLVQSHQGLFLHGGAAVALTLERALAMRARELTGVRAYQLHKECEEPLADPALEGHVRIQALFCGPNIRQAVAEGRADYIPVFLSDIPRHLRAGLFPIDVAIVSLSPPDAHGYCSLGVSVDIAQAAVETARVVIGEINRRMPRTLGQGQVHLSELDAYVVTDRPLPCHTPVAPGPVAAAIGRHVAALVPNHATLQLGIGAIPDAVLAALGDKQDLGIHSEMISDGVVDLIARGVITNCAKPIHRGITVTSFAVGSEKTYAFVDDNPAVQFFPSDHTNDTATIRKHPRMIAINSALQVDLSGQVSADSLGPTIYSGIGGQVDFLHGAALAPEGKAIIALPSTARGGVSRLVATLSEGAGVVTTRGHVQYVVTEHGVADLRGRSLRERAEALIAIADPAHREGLRDQLVRRRVIAVGRATPSA